VNKASVVICGCDDLTQVEIEVTESELEFLKKLALLVNDTSTYGCMPSMSIDGKYLETSELKAE
jgi:hypothetical protein